MTASNKYLICIKIGGSVVTDKATPHKANIKAIEQFAAELHEAWQKFNPEADFLIGNGVGSFGHFTAHKYSLRTGAQNEQQVFGVSLTHSQVRKLNTLISGRLLLLNIPAYSLSPGDMLSASKGRVTNHNLVLVKLLLVKGFVPIIHGDTVIDSTRGVSIFSTEKSLLWYAKRLSKSYSKVIIIEILDTGGVLDEKGELLPELIRGKKIKVLSSHKHDVTGGIVGKIKAVRSARKWANQITLIALKPGELCDAIAGNKVGTTIL